jgi:ankyrin repeat protein
MCRSQTRITALICAADKGHADCVRVLVEIGADKDAADNVRVLVLI